MKFAVVLAFTLALAMGVQSSVLPLLNPLALSALSSPIQLVTGPQLVHSPLVPGSVAIQASAVPSVVNAGVLGLNGHLLSAAVPQAHLGLGLGHGLGLGLGHGIGGQYVAKTRGAVHSAPLAGHIASAASINLAPAPGTI